jgi:hypothetical protein
MRLEEIAGKDTIDWLLESENPSVRYLTLTKLLGMPAGASEALEAKRSIMETGAVPKILARQNEDGSWGEPKRFYHDKYRGTVWQLIVLAELGADGEDARIRKACEFILQNSQDRDSHGFAMNASVKLGGGRSSEVIPCLTGNMVWAMIRFGLLNDERVQKGVEWICRYQRCDDGDPGEPRGKPYEGLEACFGKHSCHMGVVKALKALAAIPEEERGAAASAKIAELSEYLLIHHIYKKSHDLAAVSRPGWLKLGFPLMYQDDILEILEILTGLGYRDPRMGEALDVLKSKQNANGRWILENTFNGKMLEDIEEKGKESKWITLKALRVLAYPMTS